MLLLVKIRHDLITGSLMQASSFNFIVSESGSSGKQAVNGRLWLPTSPFGAPLLKAACLLVQNVKCLSLCSPQLIQRTSLCWLSHQEQQQVLAFVLGSAICSPKHSETNCYALRGAQGLINLNYPLWGMFAMPRGLGGTRFKEIHIHY